MKMLRSENSCVFVDQDKTRQIRLAASIHSKSQGEASNRILPYDAALPNSRNRIPLSLLRPLPVMPRARDYRKQARWFMRTSILL